MYLDLYCQRAHCDCSQSCSTANVLTESHVNVWENKVEIMLCFHFTLFTEMLRPSLGTVLK